MLNSKYHANHTALHVIYCLVTYRCFYGVSEAYLLDFALIIYVTVLSGVTGTYELV